METNKKKTYGKVLTSQNGQPPQMFDITEYIRSDFKALGECSVIGLDNGNIVIAHSEAEKTKDGTQQIILNLDGFTALISTAMYYMQLKKVDLHQELSRVLGGPNISYCCSENLNNEQQGQG